MDNRANKKLLLISLKNKVKIYEKQVDLYTEAISGVKEKKKRTIALTKATKNLILWGERELKYNREYRKKIKFYADKMEKLEKENDKIKIV